MENELAKIKTLLDEAEALKAVNRQGLYERHYKLLEEILEVEKQIKTAGYAPSLYHCEHGEEGIYECVCISSVCPS